MTEELNLSATVLAQVWPLRNSCFFKINELLEKTHTHTHSEDMRRLIAHATDLPQTTDLFPPITYVSPTLYITPSSYLIAVCSTLPSCCLLTLACPHLHLSELQEIHLIALYCKTTLSL